MKIRKCPICGKDFVLAPCNIYKLTVDGKIKNFCGWNCMREQEKENEAKKKPKEG